MNLLRRTITTENKTFNTTHKDNTATEDDAIAVYEGFKAALTLDDTHTVSSFYYFGH